MMGWSASNIESEVNSISNEFKRIIQLNSDIDCKFRRN